MSALTKIAINWEAHLEALPFPTWILGVDTENGERPSGLFFNKSCRELLGITQQALSEREVSEEELLRYIHPEDQQACLVAWNDFTRGHQTRFGKTLRWIRPHDKSTITVVVRAQRLLCGDIQGWLRPALAEQALSRLEELARGRC